MDDIAFVLSVYVGGYATLMAACLGLIFNTSGIYLLSRKENYANILNILRIVNLIWNIINLGFVIIRGLRTHFLSFATRPTTSFYIFTNSGERFTVISSILTMVALSHAQYIAVTNPFKGRQITNFWSVRKKQLLKYLLITTFLATCFTIPIIFELDNEILPSSEEHTFPSELSLNPYFSMFLIVCLDLVLLGLFPVLSLLYFLYHIRESFNKRLILTEGKCLFDILHERHHNIIIKTKTFFVIVLTLILIVFLIDGFNIVVYALFFLSFLLYYTFRIKKSLNQIYFLTIPKPKMETLTIKGRLGNGNKVSKTILVTLISFILLHSLRLVTSIGELINLLGRNNISNDDLQHGLEIPRWFQIVMPFSNFCLVIHSSTSFLIYLYLNSTITCTFVNVCQIRCLRFK